MKHVLLPNRTILRITGTDRAAFLQGLISNDVELCTSTNAIYAALLTPQGKFLYDMFVIAQGDCFLMDCDTSGADDLARRLTRHKLRADVMVENTYDTYAVYALWDYETRPEFADGIIAYADPRMTALGMRVIEPIPQNSSSPRKRGSIFCATSKMDPRFRGDDGVTYTNDYNHHRLSLGVTDGNLDMVPEKSTLLEGNFDLLNGISWTKGCYVGQELTARTHYRGLIKKRLFRVNYTGDAPALNAIITHDGAEIGEMRSHHNGIGLALLNIEKTTAAIDENKSFLCGDTVITPVSLP